MVDDRNIWFPGLGQEICDSDITVIWYFRFAWHSSSLNTFWERDDWLINKWNMDKRFIDAASDESSDKLASSQHSLRYLMSTWYFGKKS